MSSDVAAVEKVLQDRSVAVRRLGQHTRLLEVGASRRLDGLDELADLLRLTPSELVDRPHCGRGFSEAPNLRGL